MAESAERLRARTAELRTDSARRRQARDWAREAVAAVRGTAASQDGGVRATVDHAGMLLRLELAPEMRGSARDDLARAITAVIRNAAADARTQVREVYVSLLNENVIGELPSSLLPPPPIEQVSVRRAPRANATPGPEPEGTATREPGADPEGPPESWLVRNPLRDRRG
ncbi:hypothetical protein CFN78_16940 [Amycolatopsis antarctica]|uniref:YbaB/EbfC DNA-binding family protein n=1 Tax=Amycolatopsis antarctica TaxID=1854586 RepID=A0A263D426_9PSEU|nr:YbaB/EbfC family nucleoid-associated protein [Amycolatopsis antarctica]OZM72206.1 hypothetical protein CFN78_16940 [Amycolatopsis antarctica]